MEINELKERKKQLIEEKNILNSEKEVLKQVSLELFRKRKVCCLIGRCGEEKRKLRLTKVMLRELRSLNSEAGSNNLKQFLMSINKELSNLNKPICLILELSAILKNVKKCWKTIFRQRTQKKMLCWR